MSGSNKPGNGDFITSPFDDAFEFEEGDNTVNNSSSNGNGHTSGSGNWNDGHKMEEKETTLADDTDIEISSIQPTLIWVVRRPVCLTMWH